MSHQDHSSSKRRFIKGAAAVMLLSVSPFGFAASSNVIAVRIWPASSYTRVTLESTVPLKYRQLVLHNPERIVIDLEGIQLNNVLKQMGTQIQSRDPHLKLVRVGQFDPKTVRLVFEVKNKVSPQIFTIGPVAEFKNRLVMDFYPQGVSANDDPLLALLEDYNKGDLEEKMPAQAKKPGQAGRDRPIIIMIDPGHGGEDPGAMGKYKTREKDVVLQIARRLKALIDKDPEMRAYMTRNEDVFIPLKVRVAKARKMQADLFVSIHADAFTKLQAIIDSRRLH